MEETRVSLKKNPEVSANPLSRLFFCFVAPLLRVGYKRQLEAEDLPECLPEDECTHLTDRLEKLWEDELASAKAKDRAPSLTRTLVKLFGVKFLLFGILLLMEEALRIVQPIFMGGLIRYFSPSAPKQSESVAYMNALGVSLCAGGFAVLHHPYFYAVCRVGMKMRIAASTLIYRKALRLSNSSLHKTTVGHIVTLLSNDVARFDMCVVFLHYVWVVPLTMVGFVALLYHEMGISCFAGFAMMAVILPIQGYFGRKMGSCRRGVATRSDKRVGIMSEILNGIRVIKMYAWEGPFSQLIMEARKKEMKMVRLGAIFQGMVMGIFFATGHLVVLCAVVAYILLGNPMSAEKIFVAATLFNSARLSVTLFLPFAISFFFETKVTISRVQEFLMLEDRSEPQKAITNGPAKEKESLASEAIVRMTNYSGSWEEDAETPTLKDISLEAKPGQLIMIIGPVGCGKSTILASILGELSGGSGSVTARGTVAYSPQEAWVFSASLRQNILFGLDYESKKYQDTVAACSLKKDLESLPHGDQSLVGDRGVALSGGQKARVNLARAVYRDADIYLLDDPLSAVDAAVSRALFEKCIMGHLKDKIRILVTHQLQYLKHADYVLVLKEGRLMTAGTHDQLQKLGEEFTSILEETKRTFLKRQETIQEEGGGSVSPTKARRRGFSRRSASMMSSDSTEFPTTPSPVHDHDMPNMKKVGQKVIRRLSSRSPPVRQRTVSGISGASSDSSEKQPETEAFIRRDKFARSRSQSQSPNRQQSTVLEEVAMHAVSMESVYSVSKEDHAMVEQEEERNIGAVSWRVYWGYFKLMAPVPCMILPLVLFTLFVQAWYNVCDWWLKVWANQAAYEEWAKNKTDAELLNATGIQVQKPQLAGLDLTADDFMYIYLGLICALVVLALARVLWFRTALTVASIHLHRRMFKSIIRAPVAFFDNNPVGRILNRFSKDTGVMDEQLAFSFYDFLQGILQFVAILIMVGVLNPTSFIPTVPLAFVFGFVRHYYLQSSRDIKRLESTTRSPLYTHISSTLDGLSTIRAFKAEKDVLANYYYYQNIQTAAFALFLSTSRWFAVVIDWLCALYVTFVAFISILSHSGDEKGFAGDVALCLFYSIQLLGMLSHYMNQWAMLENTMVSVERIQEYCDLESEAPLESESGKKPPKDWPQTGKITFDQMSLSYGDKDAPKVLDSITCKIGKAEKIGIVGRTGAGKSSLLSALFRLTEPTGGIEIDGINILDIGLHDLRQKISIIPQDPVLFIGSLRKNLDPFDEFKDNELWEALEQVEMKSAVSALPDGIQTHMQEGGANLSVGQKQLVCLGRALLRQSRILVIDEATANVDPHTDALIQETIRNRFKECTVLTIAHRLNTIMDSDRVMVLELGHIKEFDVPHTLLQNSETDFSKLVAETGHSNAVILKKLAADAYSKRSEKD